LAWGKRRQKLRKAATSKKGLGQGMVGHLNNLKKKDLPVVAVIVVPMEPQHGLLDVPLCWIGGEN
jgi:hypothetical protein